ncbi:agamous-like mads-box protein agl6 [Phtheirospermum japonicum]|uniref:Agamous-like mads-box protein agl6 n=1 Tax=Phtheirospermum japonicum TaxID=374723 RepID=A0A830BFM6_9LAMI|nr:agamous-like mads-box protein agl6 [Phtheirospermum japonicum]
MVCSRKHMNSLCFVMLRLPLSSSPAGESSMNLAAPGIYTCTRVRAHNIYIHLYICLVYS